MLIPLPFCLKDFCSQVACRLPLQQRVLYTDVGLCSGFMRREEALRADARFWRPATPAFDTGALVNRGIQRVVGPVSPRAPPVATARRPSALDIGDLITLVRTFGILAGRAATITEAQISELGRAIFEAELSDGTVVAGLHRSALEALADGGCPICLGCDYFVSLPDTGCYCQACGSFPWHGRCAQDCPCLSGTSAAAPSTPPGVAPGVLGGQVLVSAAVPSSLSSSSASSSVLKVRMPTSSSAAVSAAVSASSDLASTSSSSGLATGGILAVASSQALVPRFASPREAYASLVRGLPFRLDKRPLPLSSPATPQPRAVKLRKTEPSISSSSRGSQGRIQTIEADQREVASAIAAYEADKTAASGTGVHQSHIKWWLLRAAAAGLVPFPLSVDSLKLALALLKSGGFRSAPAYLNAMKREHIKMAEWTQQLEQEARAGIRSCLRGLGPPKKCPSFDLREVAALDELPPVALGPLRPRDTVLLTSWFAMRELEASTRRRKHVRLIAGAGCGIVVLDLPVSKTDPTGAGVTRKHGCSCGTGQQALCPVAAARRILEAGARFGDDEDLPFFINSAGKAPEKTRVVETFRAVGERLGWTVEQTSAITGHLPRPTGAQFLVRSGLALYLVQLFCRWGSDAILGYLREIPLSASDEWAAELSLEEVRVQAFSSLKSRAGTGQVDEGALQATVERVLARKLEDASASWKSVADAALLTLENVKAGIVEAQGRDFRPPFVENLSTGVLHAVKDDSKACCGYVFRTDLMHRLTRSFEGGTPCKRQGCAPLLKRELDKLAVSKSLEQP
jgi:hypothetical protein